MDSFSKKFIKFSRQCNYFCKNLYFFQDVRFLKFFLVQVNNLLEINNFWDKVVNLFSKSLAIFKLFEQSELFLNKINKFYRHNVKLFKQKFNDFCTF